jgi:hypothetical protein
MKAHILLGVSLALFLAGCSDRPAPKGPTADRKADDPEAQVKANLARLPPEDRKLAEAQRYCAVESENRLGSMGAPYKVLVNDQPVFLCCKGCRKAALADPERTLAQVKRLKEKSAAP